MTWQPADRIADALLYEGYLLYPYRATAAKNRYRWQFGVIAPRACSDAADCGPWRIQTECLLDHGDRPAIDVKIRFLQLETRRVERLASPPDLWQPVDAITVDGRDLVTWDEARPREFLVSDLPVSEPFIDRVYPLEVEGGRGVELVRDTSGEVVAREVRERCPISCLVFISVEAPGDLRKVSVRIENVTPCPPGVAARRDDVLRRSVVGAHTLLAISDGAFLSLLDPPAHAKAATAGCKNIHTWPVLVGPPPMRNLILSAPIILYDYPSVAPESPGDLFDATEIDELLTLRVLTMAEGERREALATDPRAREIVERAAALPPKGFERLHGAIRHLRGAVTHATDVASDRSAWEELLNPAEIGGDETLGVNGRRIEKGSHVRLCPSPGRADAMDMFLVGQTATVAAVYRDLEGQAHIAVTVDAAQAKDIHEAHGRYFYFRADEVEVLDVHAAHPTREAASATAGVLVAGIGNIFLSDDGFGPAVIQRLASRALPGWIRVEDFGIRGVHLAYEILGASPSYDTLVIVDAVSRGRIPGTLYVLEPDVGDASVESPDAHTLTVEGLLGLLERLDAKPRRVVLVACDAGSVAPGMGLSDSVAAAVDGAVELVLKLLLTKAD